MSKNNTHEHLEFNDNALLPLLYGEHNTHLRYLEDKLKIEFSDRGNTLDVRGNSRDVKNAVRILKTLWEKLEDGQKVSVAEIDTALRFVDDKNMTEKKKTASSNIVIHTRKKDIAPRSPNQATYIQALKNNNMVFGLGPAGTGKTYLAVAVGVAMYLAGDVERLIFCRPAVEAGENLGFLPGDMKEKIDPYLRPIYDALHDMIPHDMLEKKMIAGEIEIAPLAFMRGRTLSRAFVILDEGQNATSTQMRMFLTRMGENSHMVITGDITQTDLPKGVISGLREAKETLEGIDGIEFINFEYKDVIRHALVGKIVQAYAKKDNQ